MGVPRAARASLSGAFRAGSGKEGGVGRIGGRAAVAAGGAGGGGGADRNGGRPDVERRARSRGSCVCVYLLTHSHSLKRSVSFL